MGDRGLQGIEAVIERQQGMAAEAVLDEIETKQASCLSRIAYLSPADGSPRASWVSHPFVGLGAVRFADRQPEQLIGEARAYPAGQEQGS